MSILSPVQIAELERAADSALFCQKATQLPADLTIAQWALESGWGAHQPGNNCFGIKAYPGCYGVQWLHTFEVIAGVRSPVLKEFATFPSLASCFAKHASLFTLGKPYAEAWARYLKTGDVETLIRQIAPIYATDPNYADELLRIRAMPEVEQSLKRESEVTTPKSE